jgi:ribosomal protein S21
MKRRNFNNHKKKLTGVVTVSLDECRGNTDVLIRRFIKRTKKEGIVEEFRSRSRYKKASDKKREKRNELKRRICKENKQKSELFNITRGSRKAPGRRR